MFWTSTLASCWTCRLVDGYTAYNAFPIEQRCWVYILRKAEKFAIRKGGNYLSCYLRLLAMYKGIKDRVCRLRRMSELGEGRA